MVRLVRWAKSRLLRMFPTLTGKLAYEPDVWELGDPDPMYYIIDDQYNHERYLYGNDPFNPGWLLSTTQALRGHAGWGLGTRISRKTMCLSLGSG
jgi:hypothetical protein